VPLEPGKLAIFNMALGFIGTRTIASPNEETLEAAQCQLFWDRARRSVLCDYPRDHPWPFAWQRVQLAQRVFPEVYDGVWKYCYGWPNEALRIIAIHNPGKGRHDRTLPFVVRNIENSSAPIVANQAIFCDISPAQAECIVDVVDERVYDPLFTQLVSRKLACYIAIPLLKNNQNKIQELEQLYDVAFQKANEQAVQENLKEDLKQMDDGRRWADDHDPWLLARGGLPPTRWPLYNVEETE